MRKIEDWKGKLFLVVPILLMYGLMYLTKQTCFVKAIVGFNCPCCGMTRAALSLLRLDFAAAFTYHPLVWTLPILLLYYLYDGEPIRNKKINYGLLIFIGALFLVVWILRLAGVIPAV